MLQEPYFTAIPLWTVQGKDSFRGLSGCCRDGEAALGRAHECSRWLPSGLQGDGGRGDWQPSERRPHASWLLLLAASANIHR